MAEQPKENFKYIVRIANVDIPGEKQVRIALTKIKGIGTNLADVLCTLAGINKSAKTGNLSDKDIASLNTIVSDPLKHGLPTWFVNRRKDYETGETTHLITGKLQFTQDNDLKRLKKIKTLRGARHQKGLTVRGQRTRSNFRKSKGKVIGVKKKK
ncbi:MAG: 30S ribosomal protein S13 [archaeon]|nr:30S ribosomal protein S13 [archaeon]